MLVQDLPSLFSALVSKDFVKACDLIGEKCKNLEIIKNKLGETLLHISTNVGFTEFVGLLLDKGFDVDSLDYRGKTALHLAVVQKNIDMVRYLLEYKASTNIKDNYGQSPFHMAVQLGDINIVELFLRSGADILDITTESQETVFHIALRNEDLNVFMLLLQNFPDDINVSDAYGETLLHILARQRNEHVAQLVLERGASLACINKKDGETALHLAVNNRNFNICKLFLDFGAYVNASNARGESPLYLAVRCKELRIVELLLMNNASVHQLTWNTETILNIAIHYYNEDIFKLLLTHGAQVDGLDSIDTLPPIFLAIRNKCFDAVKILISYGADPNLSLTQDKHIGQSQILSPLHAAIRHKDILMVKFLLDNGAELDTRTHSDIFQSVMTGSEEIVEHLIKKGTDINVCNTQGMSLLFAALYQRQKKIVKMLLQYGANKKHINEKAFGESALHFAVKQNDYDFVEFLLKIGIDVNICCDNHEFTALNYAQENKNIANLIISNIALLKVQNLFVCAHNERLIQMVPEFQLYYTICLKELLEIKEARCNGISFTHFLTKDEYCLAKSIRQVGCDDFKALININRYPIYFKLLEENADKGLARLFLLNETKNLLCAFDFFRYLYDLLDDIVAKLSNEELERIISDHNLDFVKN